MSSVPRQAPRWYYGLAALLFLGEAGIVWLMVHPDVPANYRAYYIDRTTTCLAQPVSGDYRIGQTLSFLPANAEAIAAVRVCGWEGPAGDGLHAVGTSSRLRFHDEEAPRPTRLIAELSAVSKGGEVQPQQVNVVVNGEPVATWQVTDARPQEFSASLPDGLFPGGPLEVAFEFPNAVRMGATDPDTRWRSVKLQSAVVTAEN